MARGKFIVLDGPEGCGKTTQARRLHEWLQDQGKKVLLTREPGGTRLGETLRTALLDKRGPGVVPRAELFLFLADRAQHLEEVVVPALERGEWVVSDRFSTSTLAYQGIAQGLGLEAVGEMDAFARQGVEPDLTIVLDVAAEVGLDRVSLFGHQKIEERGVAFHRRVREGFLSLAAQDPRCVVIDASASESKVWGEVRRAVKERLLSERR